MVEEVNIREDCDFAPWCCGVGQRSAVDWEFNVISLPLSLSVCFVYYIRMPLTFALLGV